MRPTRLQAATVALRDLLLAARAELDDTAYSWLVAIGAEVFGREAARLFVCEALRAIRDEDERRAA